MGETTLNPNNSRKNSMEDKKQVELMKNAYFIAKNLFEKDFSIKINI